MLFFFFVIKAVEVIMEEARHSFKALELIQQHENTLTQDLKLAKLLLKLENRLRTFAASPCASGLFYALEVPGDPPLHRVMDSGMLRGIDYLYY